MCGLGIDHAYCSCVSCLDRNQAKVEGRRKGGPLGQREGDPSTTLLPLTVMKWGLAAAMSLPMVLTLTLLRAGSTLEPSLALFYLSRLEPTPPPNCHLSSLPQALADPTLLLVLSLVPLGTSCQWNCGSCPHTRSCPLNFVVHHKPCLCGNPIVISSLVAVTTPLTKAT